MTSTEARTCILVAGMHRSGTSALTRMISFLGAALPENLMAPSPEFNAPGFWESRDVVALDDAVLRAVGSRWDDVLAFEPSMLPAAERRRFEDGVAALCESQFRDEGLFVIKDPRLARLLDLWIPALRGLGIVPKVVLPYRHPLEVAASLARRDDFSVATSIQLWLRHMLDGLALDAGVALATVGYDELLADWPACAGRIERALGLSWPRPVHDVRADIDGFLQAGLRHHDAGAQGRPDRVPGLDMALELYAALGVSTTAALAAAAPLRARFDALQADIAPLLRDLRGERRKDEVEHAALRAEFDVKCRHVEQLETTLSTERAGYRRLEREFEEKCTHVTSLLAEVAALRAAAPSGGDPDGGGLHAGLVEIEALLRRRQAGLQERRERDERALQQCRTEIVRAEAQLDLLKNLFLDH